MLKLHNTLLVALPILLSACASGPPFADQIQPTAIEMAVRRGQFEMNCPSATGSTDLQRNHSTPCAAIHYDSRAGGIYRGCHRLRETQQLCRDLSRQWQQLLFCRRLT